eukprot:TRINITY_DN24248_c0_g1_i1.p1 TRINITY_DN24248_c0_g1~~TRINITY_DN24248_c0_g1_i1.p1  ORF type:complete len:1411 (+),score=252.27 TRINITY_DN24248_c0_g1_i1:81-4235(+)
MSAGGAPAAAPSAGESDGDAELVAREDAPEAAAAARQGYSGAAADSSAGGQTARSASTRGRAEEEEERDEEEEHVLLRDAACACEPYSGEEQAEVGFEGPSAIAGQQRYWCAVLLVHLLAGDPAVLAQLLTEVHVPEGTREGLEQLCRDHGRKGLPKEMITAACASIPPPMRFGLIVALITTALKSGRYDARLRWAFRRAALILAVPWPRVAAAEQALAGCLLEHVHAHSPQQQKQRTKGGVKRWLKIGAGVVVGGTLLVVTGGLAAPVIAGAAAGIATATATVASAAGLTALAAAVTTGAATLLGVLSVGVIAGLFGAAGAGLTGWRVYRRTGSLSEFVCLPARLGAEAWDSLPDGVAAEPCAVLASRSGAGPVVLLNARGTVASAMAERLGSRTVAAALEHRAPALGALRLAGSYAQGGSWRYEWPPLLPVYRAAVAAVDRSAASRVKGTRAGAVYQAHSGQELCVAFELPVVGAARRAIALGASGSFSGDVPHAVSNCLDRGREWQEITEHGTRLAAHCGGEADCPVYSVGETQHTPQLRAVCCTPAEMTARTRDAISRMSARSQRTALVVSNGTRALLRLGAAHISSGEAAPECPVPEIVPPGGWGVCGLQNKRLRPTGVSATAVFNSDTFSVCIALHIGAGGGVRVGGAVAPSGAFAEQDARDQVSKDAASGAGTASVALLADAGSHLVVIVTWTVEDHVVTVRVREAAAGRGAALPDHSGLHVAVALDGLILAGDPRVTPAVRDPALWVPTLAQHMCALNLDGADPYFITWESELRKKFGETLDSESDYGAMARSAADTGARTAMKNPAVAGAAGAAGASYAALSTVAAAIAFPYYAVQAGSIIDSEYSLINSRAKDAGAALADMLLSHAQGQRPVTLIGATLGGNVVFHCLQCLAQAADGAGLGVVESAYILGATVTADAEKWTAARRVVAGRLVNVHSGRDWWLGFLHRSNSVSLRTIAGLGRVEGVRGLENVSVAHLVHQTTDYIRKLPEVLDAIPGWPTRQTLALSSQQPGTVAPLSEADAAAAVTAESSLASSKLALAVRNKSGTITLELSHSDASKGRWEATPPAQPIPALHAAIMAARGSMLGGRGQICVCAVFAIVDQGAELRVAARRQGATLSCAACVAEPSASDGQATPKEDFAPRGKRVDEVQGRRWLVRWSCAGDCVAVTIREAAKEDDVSESSDDESERGERQLMLPATAGLTVPQQRCWGELSAAAEGARGTLLGGWCSGALAVRNKTPYEMCFAFDDVQRGSWQRIPSATVPPAHAAICAYRGGLRSGGAAGVLCFALEGQCALLIAWSTGLSGPAAVHAALYASAEEAEAVDRYGAVAAARSTPVKSVQQLAGSKYKLSVKPAPGASDQSCVSVKLLPNADS